MLTLNQVQGDEVLIVSELLQEKEAPDYGVQRIEKHVVVQLFV